MRCQTVVRHGHLRRRLRRGHLWNSPVARGENAHLNCVGNCHRRRHGRLLFKTVRAFRYRWVPLLCQTHTAATNRKQPEGHSSVYGIPSLRRYGRQAGDKRQSRRQKGEKDDSRHAPVANRASRQALSAILTSGLFPAGRKRRNDHPTTAYLRFARSGERHPSRACARVLTVQTCPKAADLSRRNKAPVGSDRMANTETDRCAASQRAVVGGGRSSPIPSSTATSWPAEPEVDCRRYRSRGGKRPTLRGGCDVARPAALESGSRSGPASFTISRVTRCCRTAA